MVILPELPAIHQRVTYTPAKIRDLIKRAADQGFPTGPESYLNQMTLCQVDALLDGRFYA
jgi:hypothetical protein